MNVALISHGGLDHVEPFLSAMVRAGWKAHWLQIAPGRLSFPGVEVHKCFTALTQARGLGKLDLLVAARLVRRQLARIRPNAVSAHYASSGGFVAWASGYRPYMVTAHGSDILVPPPVPGWRFLVGCALRAADRVNPVAAHMLPIIESLGVARTKCVVQNFGIDIDKLPFAPRAIRPDEPLRVICTRPLERSIYDIPTCLAGVAWARSRGTDVLLMLAGRGEARPHQEQARRLGISGAVTFLGGFIPSQLPGLLAGHSVYLSASRSDGSSLSLMEALAAGLIPVVTDIPANREWLTSGVNGLMFPVGGSTRLGECLASLRGRHEWMTAIARQNRSLVEDRANRRLNLDRWMDLLKEMATSTSL